MQKIKIADIEVKEGDSDRGHWQNYIITGEDKTKVNTFDHQASGLKVGDIIEAEIELKGKYANIKSFKVIEKALIEPPKKEQEKTRTRDDDIAEAVAVKAVVDLASNKVLPPDHPLVQKVLSWCSEKLGVYNMPDHSKIPDKTAKPSESQPLTSEDAKKALIALVMEEMNHRSEKTAITWLLNVAKIPENRLENEPEEVAQELITKYKWQVK